MANQTNVIKLGNGFNPTYSTTLSITANTTPLLPESAAVPEDPFFQIEPLQTQQKIEPAPAQKGARK